MISGPIYEQEALADGPIGPPIDSPAPDDGHVEPLGYYNCIIIITLSVLNSFL